MGGARKRPVPLQPPAFDRLPANIPSRRYRPPTMPRKISSRRLTERQKNRIESLREERRCKRADTSLLAWERLAQSELLAPEQGRVISHFGYNVEVEDPQGARFRCAVRETAGMEPVCGDRVSWSRAGNLELQGVIWSVVQRKNALPRPVLGGGVQIVAANIDLLMVTLAADKPNLGLLDRYLVAASINDMEPIILVNKMDRLPDPNVLNEPLQPYVAMQYPICYVSAHTGQGIVDIERLIQGRTGVFAGHSGVGKSSIVAHWVPPADRPLVGEAHEPTGAGRHTTTVARLYHLPGGGMLIDSPGVREFGLMNVSRRSLAHYFRDMVVHAGPCRFTDCSHRHEPDCGIKNAVSEGKVTRQRYDSMVRIFNSLPDT
ncbi:MAG: ribosome small subunit-dependent GTPase A [Magnetococcales bacterium]|nr:ribosome small subunit-dependent GTPase A [Magnetococcales bacterium]